jgi:excisionase family DNA binding protein
MEDRDVLTIAQAADYLQFHREKVYRLVREGKLPAARIGKDWRIKRADIEALLESAKVTSAQNKPRNPRRPSARKKVR